MITQFYGYKSGQEQTFNDEGNRLVVTRINTFPLKAVRTKSEDNDGYLALQVQIRKKSPPKASAFKRTGKKQKLLLREIKLEQKFDFKPGDELKVQDVFKLGDKIQVKGITKGKGFAGVVKRWGFAGGPKTHGQSDRHRAPGSIGQGTDPGRVWKGKKMPGHMGSKAKTIKGLKVYKIDEKAMELWVTGLVPGVKGGLLKITKCQL